MSTAPLLRLQACLTVLTDLMHLLPDNLPAQNPQTQPYVSLGLPARPDRDDLRSALLTAVQGYIYTHNEAQLFATHGLPLCLKWLVVLASAGMDSYAQGHDILSGAESCRSLVMSCSLLVGELSAVSPHFDQRLRTCMRTCNAGLGVQYDVLAVIIYCSWSVCCCLQAVTNALLLAASSTLWQCILPSMLNPPSVLLQLIMPQCCQGMRSQMVKQKQHMQCCSCCSL